MKLLLYISDAEGHKTFSFECQTISFCHVHRTELTKLFKTQPHNKALKSHKGTETEFKETAKLLDETKRQLIRLHLQIQSI